MENLPFTQLLVADRAAAAAQAARWNAVLSFRDEQLAALDRQTDLSPMRRRMAVNRIALDVAQCLRISEQTVWRIVEAGERLRSRTPLTWQAFLDGRISEQKASVISSVIDRVQLTPTLEALDREAPAHAATHTPGELRRWLIRLVDRLEPPAVEECDQARENRGIEVVHGDDGMSWINAHIPTVAAAAIVRRLRKAARQFRLDHPDDTRSSGQREADLFCAWLTNATGTDCDIVAEVAVVVEAAALAGVTDTPAVVDHVGGMPAAWVLELADSGSTLWTRLLTDPTGRVLDVTHVGYQPPAALRRAIRWRDMTCRVEGCATRAEDTDIDHITAYDSGGSTTGRNLRSLCRRHHGMKGHGLLPEHVYAPAEVHVVRLPRPPFQIDLYDLAG